MVLHYLWVGMMLIALAIGFGKWILFGDLSVLEAFNMSLPEMSEKGFTLALNLTGALAFWLGLLKIAEKAGLIDVLTRWSAPFFSRLFPDMNRSHDAYGAIMMNFAANMLGLDNAATPLGLKAMKALQEVNLEKERATNAMIMFLVINTAGLTIIPISVMAFRAQAGAANPSDILVPSILGTLISAMSGILITAVIQKINLLHRAVLLTFAFFMALVCGMAFWFGNMSPEQATVAGNTISYVLIAIIVASFIIAGMLARINVYESFVEGAKEGFGTAIGIIPYLIAMLVAIGAFRASGALDMILHGVAWCVGGMGLNTDFVPALPVGIMKPFSGSGARGLMIDTMTQYGADSFVGKASSVLQGGTETTFYTLAVYYGSINVKNTRYTASVGLVVDVIGVAAGVLLAYLFFH